jgi:hypothetical protein
MYSFLGSQRLDKGLIIELPTMYIFPGHRGRFLKVHLVKIPKMYRYSWSQRLDKGSHLSTAVGILLEKGI